MGQNVLSTLLTRTGSILFKIIQIVFYTNCLRTLKLIVIIFTMIGNYVTIISNDRIGMLFTSLVTRPSRVEMITRFSLIRESSDIQ
jgi:hypothetical protein